MVCYTFCDSFSKSKGDSHQEMPVEKEKGDEKRAKRKERASVTDGSDHEPLENFLKQLEQLEEL